MDDMLLAPDAMGQRLPIHSFHFTNSSEYRSSAACIAELINIDIGDAHNIGGLCCRGVLVGHSWDMRERRQP